eukprot:CFRG7140T1
MSLEINWELLTQEHSKLAKDFLNEKLKTVVPETMSAGLGNVVIHELKLGDRSPTVELIDLSNPFEAMAYPENYNEKDPMFDLEERLYYREDAARIAQVESTADCVQIRTRIAYRGNALLKVSADVQVNVPSPAFIALPVELSVRNLHIDVEVIAYVRENKDVRISLLHSIQHNSPLVDASFDTHLGDESQSVLRNVEKIQVFIVTAIRTLLTSHLIYPRSIVFPLPSQTNEDA